MAAASSKPPLRDKESRDFDVTDDNAGDRLDRWLAWQVADLSRSRLRQLIDQGEVKLDGAVHTVASTILKAGQTVRLHLPAPVAVTLAAQAMDLDVVFEDKHLIVVNKPAGLVVHPAAGNPDKTLVNALLAHCGGSLLGIGGELRPGIVHRLDKDTSGLLVAAKSGAAHANLGEQFAEHTIERAYDALVWGVPKPPRGIITARIGRSNSNRKKMATRNTGGKHAETHYKCLETFDTAAAWVECVLKTGRTHQIRVHMASIGHQVMGDPTYGTMRTKYLKLLDPEAAALVRDFKRQALHARVLGFTHPITGKVLRFERPAPDDFQAIATALRQSAD